MRRFIYKLILFGSLFLVILLSQKVLDNYTPWYWGNEQIYTKLDYLSDKHTAYDAYFIGSSRTYRNTNPVVFDSITGLKSFNVGTAGTRPPELYLVVDHFIAQKTKNGPKQYLLVELTAIDEGPLNNENLIRQTYWVNTDSYSLGMGQYLEQPIHPRSPFWYTRGFLRNQTKFGMGRRQYLSMSEESDQLHVLGPLANGYLSIEKQIELGILVSERTQARLNFLKDSAKFILRKQSIVNETLVKNKTNFRTHLARIHELIAKAEVKNISLVFVKLPIQEGKLALYNAIPEANKIDMAAPSIYPVFYQTSSYFDQGHFTEEVASIYTTYLADSFLKKFPK